MNYSVFRFTLNMHNHRSQVSIPVFVGDTGIRLLISLTDGGNTYFIEDGCVAMLRGKKPDGNPIFNQCLILNNTTIQYDFTEQTAIMEGIVNCEIDLYGADGTLITAPKFIIVVDSRSVPDTDIAEAISESIPDINLPQLMALTASEQGRVEAEEIRKANELERQAKETERQANEVNRIALYEGVNNSIANLGSRITENTNGVANLDTRVSENDRRITSLENKAFPFVIDSDVAYIKEVPENALPYAVISKIGGMSYKDGDTLKDAKVTEVKSVGVSNTYTLAIPEAVQNLEGYGIGFDTKYCNYIDFENKKFIQKVRKRVFTGDEAWEWGESIHEVGLGAFWLSDFTDVNRSMGITGLGICNHFEFNAQSTDENGKFRFQGSTDGNRCYFYLPQSEINSAEQAKALVKSWYNGGNPLTVEYVSKDFIETDISDLIADVNLIGVEGGGTLTFENEYGYDVPSEVYYQIEGVTV